MIPTRRVEDHGLEVLDDAACMGYLAAGAVGRLGFTSGAMPVVVPVNYRLAGTALVFSTESGAKLSAAIAGHVACLEVDDWESLSHEGWSVLATGRLEVITEPEELVDAARLPLAPWRRMATPHFVRLPIELLSGRRLRPLGRGVPD